MSNRKSTKKNVNATTPDTAPAGRKGHQLPARAPDPMWAVLQTIAKADRRSVAQTVLILLEEALAARGHDLSGAVQEDE